MSAEKKRITLGDVETMVLAAKQRSLYEIDRCHLQQSRVRSLGSTRCDLNSAKAERGRDWTHLHAGEDFSPDAGNSGSAMSATTDAVGCDLWQGFRVPPFAADDII